MPEEVKARIFVAHCRQPACGATCSSLFVAHQRQPACDAAHTACMGCKGRHHLYACLGDLCFFAETGHSFHTCICTIPHTCMFLWPAVLARAELGIFSSKRGPSLRHAKHLQNKKGPTPQKDLTLVQSEACLIPESPPPRDDCPSYEQCRVHPLRRSGPFPSTSSHFSVHWVSALYARKPRESSQACRHGTNSMVCCMPCICAHPCFSKGLHGTPWQQTAQLF